MIYKMMALSALPVSNLKLSQYYRLRQNFLSTQPLYQYYFASHNLAYQLLTASVTDVTPPRSIFVKPSEQYWYQ